MNKWAIRVLTTEISPTQSQLQLFGDLGFELLTILFDEETKEWYSYFKKQEEPIDLSTSMDVEEVSRTIITNLEQGTQVSSGSISTDNTPSSPNQVDDIPF